MPVESYSLALLEYDKCKIKFVPEELLAYLRAWRKGHAFATVCSECDTAIAFSPDCAFAICCGRFYYDNGLSQYPVESIAILTPGYEFALPQLKKILRKHPELQTNQHFIVIPDPIYWQLRSTLVYEKIMKFVMGKPMTNRTTVVQNPQKSGFYYKELQNAPLNYGSLAQRSCGKATLIRQIAFGKRCTLSMRAMIVPDSGLRPNEIALPRNVIESFQIENRWIVLNRMPSLQPENFVTLRVTKSWPYACIGIPLEIVESLNADFDGDECNLYVLQNIQSQAECEEILNSEKRMGSLTTGLRLAPSQDMIVAYRMFRDEIDFLPYSHSSLKTTFRVVYDLWGSGTAFDCFDRMRKFYLRVLHERRVFGITLAEIGDLIRWAEASPDVETFETVVRKEAKPEACLVTQIESGAKGSYDHLFQMFGSVGDGVASSFWKGLTPSEAVLHGVTASDALSQMGKIWEPGYSYSKSVYNLQGLTVDYAGRLVDGNCIVELDAIDAMHATDLMSEEAFECLLQEEILKADCGMVTN